MGYTKAENLAGEFYSLEKLCEILSQNWQHSAAAIKMAAIAVDSDRIMELIDEIPSNYLILATELSTLVRKYSFDKIIALTEKL
ncbi:hypothetical protein [Myxosarcina sp. GI1]|uniref:hypothetical protein n=1 Tax=Myxosarcina sp. GI1 TaxID=1541065 RepID=UPI0005617D8B|nr:hypothetical protein [Myxosarcina sp. GI1]